MRPNAFTVSSRARSTSLMSVTSTATATILPRLLSSLAVFSAKALSRSQIATEAPDSRNRSTIALPIPCAPPVTTAKRPERSILLAMACSLEWACPIQANAAMRAANCQGWLVERGVEGVADIL